MARAHQKSARIPLWLPALLCLAVFVMDVLTPLGFAAGIGYVPLVFCSLWFRHTTSAFVMAGIATALTILGFFVSPPPPTEITLHVVIANRFISVSAVWFVAVLVYLQQKADRLLQKSVEQQRAVLETTVDGIMTIDTRGIVQSFNPACTKIFGYAAAEVIGNNVSMLMTQENSGRHDSYLKHYGETRQAKIIGIGREVMGLRKDGSEVPLDLSVSEMYIDGQVMYSGIVRDISERKKAEEALREKKEELQMIFDSVPLILCYKDDTNRIVRANKTLADSMNLTTAELDGSDTATYFPELADKYYRDDMEVIESGKPKLGIIETIRDGKGEIRWLRTDKVPHTDPKTGKRGVLAVAQDITSIIQTEKALREKTEELQRIFDSVPVSIWYKDDHNTILRCNRLAAESAGRTPEQLIGRNTAEFFPEMAEKYLADDREVISSGKPKLGIIEQYTPKYGEHGWIRTDKVPFLDPNTGQPALVAVAQDITSIKQAEQRLEALVAELTDSNEQLERFAYICSHDLQEPLRIIRNYVALLERQCADVLVRDEKAQRYMGYIAESAERSQALISDVLAYARLDQEAKPHVPVDLNQTFNAILHNLGQSVAEKQAKITCDDLPVATGNPTQFLQLFQNLISNALKFSTTAPAVHVSAQQTAAGWEFSVRDNGIGIEPEYQHKIFIIFQRLHRRSDYPGTGIGLAICKKVVENYGGAIHVESALGKGTVFRFTLPQAFPDMLPGSLPDKRHRNITAPTQPEGGTS